MPTAAPVARRPFVIFTYHRDARGFAARALRAAGIVAEYRSVAALRHDGAPRCDATPRYLGEATDEEMARVLAHLTAADAYGVDAYHD